MAGLNGQSDWLAVIGRSLAFLCLSKAMESEPGKYDTVLKKVAFLEGLGLRATPPRRRRAVRRRPWLNCIGKAKKKISAIEVKIACPRRGG